MNSKIRRYSLFNYLLGALPARLGDEMSGQAILLTTLAMTGSVSLGSSILASLTFSAAIGGPLLGAILDRSQYQGRNLATFLGLYAFGLSMIAISLGHMPTWVLVSMALLTGLLMPSISGGWSSRLKSFIATENMKRASAIDATTFNIAGLAGPALAGLIAVWVGAQWSIVVLVGLLISALPMAWSLPEHHSRQQTHNTSLIQGAITGFGIIITNRLLLRITLTSAISYVGIGMLWVVYPVIGKELMGRAGYGGVMASVLSGAALLATLAYTRWPTRYPPDTVTFITTLMLAIAMLVLALASSVLATLAAMILAGLADGPQLAAIFAVRHREASERSRAQVFTTGASLKITAAAIGTTIAGRLATYSLRLTLLTAAAIQILAALAYLLLSIRLIVTADA